ncbi:VHS domain-containing protein [Nannizzia gypsea CBS 118893]|uniref:VHS domain-containing protein n=1 Tax=Arthroderma gypseum (strain ATCC MYA-4604 / CBS 118893) TaxID=535722 RepID=E4V4D9_ARTGP|nr:VHS domain-containing protein [Nannizzia gypsea CBS 118893]EFR04863.1 VHS domain-containing protein [Nannizzia gypsea CBS 118893]
MFSGTKKPYTAITVQIDSLTAEQYEVDDWSGIPDLIEVIRLQASGPSEASRALRKKLKYGNVHRQLRALTILDFLIQNAGERFHRSFADEPLLERLRVIATDPHTDALVKEKCQQLYSQWAVSFKGVAGMERVTALYRQLPKRKRRTGPENSNILKEPADEPLGHSVSIVAGDGPSRNLSSATPSSSSNSKSLFDSKKKNKQKLERQSITDKHTKTKAKASDEDVARIKRTVADVGFAITRLENAMKLVNREQMRVSQDKEVMCRVDECKVLRSELLKFIHKLDDENYLGILIHSHEEIINALLAFEVMDKSVDDDSDSEQELDLVHANAESSPPAKPPRPQMVPSLQFDKDKDLESESEQSDDDDINNPFGDRNAISTPALEKSGMTW